MKMKKIALLAASMVTLVAVSVGGTMAYLTADASATNVFTIGNVKIAIEEPSWPATGTVNIEPGQTVTKDPFVKNTGLNPAYIRVKVDIPTGTINDVANTKLFTLGTLGTGWTLESDGYYYYDGIVQPNGQTSKLFEQVTLINSYAENGDTAVDKDIVVTAEAVQTKGLTNNDGTEVTTAQQAFAAVAR